MAQQVDRGRKDARAGVALGREVERVEELRAVVEVAVEGGARDTGGGDNPVERGRRIIRQERARGVEDAVLGGRALRHATILDRTSSLVKYHPSCTGPGSIVWHLT